MDSKKLLVGLSVLFVALLMGCDNSTRQEEVTTGYGRRAGSDYVNSVNGTSILASMYRDAGSTVNRADSISPRIDGFDRIVWFRDRYEAPNQEAIDTLDQWLRDGYQRQLVVVGRDYDSAIEYWTGVCGHVTGRDLMEARRRRAVAKAEFQRRRTGRDMALDHCDWFDIQENDYRKATSFEGPWAGIIDPDQADLFVGQMLHATVSPATTPWSSRYQSVVKLSLDSEPMVTKLTKNQYNQGEILVISNASFLTNYSLINSENRKLAQFLVNTGRFASKTLFLETGPSEVRISDDTTHQTWAWITKPPLKYMVPHFLMLGVFFCFVLYPIFGHARRDDPGKDNTSFRDHIRAMGKLMSNSRNAGYAKEKVQKYANRHWKEHDK